MNELTRYDLPFDSKTFIKWLGRVGKENLRLIETAIEAADHIEETGYYELPAQFTTSGRPEIFWDESYDDGSNDERSYAAIMDACYD